ncbi:cation diffusion facilitator family transporter [Alkalihalobacillus xiaoxiensis]|uniref:Cation diffusion facilitator family transporter n=1 Tax=Shouchella xiaoxiensis TaxID=766895 RepID=A0ABS2SXE1_9BACI|nr:cation diffusion facilitator family transporter [Shouchella xiaoxiensis]MBM7839866.1 cation diffusion facilitator family transporter [Shouchella xiaoxiensis]
MEEKYQDLRYGERGALLSLVTYMILAALKLTIGIYAGSIALRADGFNNVTDIVVSIAVLIGLRVSQKPPDKDHPYGHWKAESIAALIASFIIMVVGIQVLIDAISSFYTGNYHAPDPIAAWVGGFGFVVMMFVYLYNRKLAKKINSQAIDSVAKDNLSDALVSLGATLGIIGAQFGIAWLDPVLAIIVGLIICHTAWGIFRNSSHSLTDGVSESELEQIEATTEQIEQVLSVKRVKARYYGNNLIVDLVIELDQTISFTEAHNISTLVENQVKQQHQALDVHVHVEPQS